MATILSDIQTNQIKQYRNMLRPYYDRGWMCEGGEHQRGDGSWILCNVIFNNETSEFFRADYDGNILYNGLVSTPIKDAEFMAKIEGKMRRIV